MVSFLTVLVVGVSIIVCCQPCREESDSGSQHYVQPVNKNDPPSPPQAAPMPPSPVPPTEFLETAGDTVPPVKPPVKDPDVLDVFDVEGKNPEAIRKYIVGKKVSGDEVMDFLKRLNAQGKGLGFQSRAMGSEIVERIYESTGKEGPEERSLREKLDHVLPENGAQLWQFLCPR